MLNSKTADTKEIERGSMNDIKNVRIFATSRYRRDGINLYIDFSGQREYMMHYRYNKALYRCLSKGVSLDELRELGRGRHAARAGQAVAHAAKHITKVADDFIKYDWLPYKQAV